MNQRRKYFRPPNSVEVCHGNAIVLLSGHSFPEVERHTLASGVDGVITARAEHLGMLMLVISAVTALQQRKKIESECSLGSDVHESCRCTFAPEQEGIQATFIPISTHTK